MRMLSAKETAEKWNVTERQVTGLCKQGRIPGAVKKGRTWNIPETAEKPEDNRVTSGKYRKAQDVRMNLRPLPIGSSQFTEVVSECYFVDKTLLIKECLETPSKVFLFTRPRRFGKTLNMDMLRVFFEKTEEDTSLYFRDKLVWEEGARVTRHQGQYPTIFLSLKDAKSPNWETTLQELKSVLVTEFSRHPELSESTKCIPADLAYYKKLVSLEFKEIYLQDALLVLSRMLHMHYCMPVVILIDEYDTPILEGYTGGFYDTVISFMRVFLSKAFKDNPHLFRGFLTGVLRVAKESVFSGLNNLYVSSVLDKTFSSYFGFTHHEVEEVCLSHGLMSAYDAICEWYDGYRFGETEIFNPWSIANFMSHKCEAQPYWVNTSSNDLVGSLLEHASATAMEELIQLMRREALETSVVEDVAFPQLTSDLSTIYSFLLFTGYLKCEEVSFLPDGNYNCNVSIPNKEVSTVFRREVLQRFGNGVKGSAVSTNLFRAIQTGSASALQTHLVKFLQETVSYFDTAKESFYHGLLLGLCAVFSEDYFITSNRESGDGRYDIELCPRHPVRSASVEKDNVMVEFVPGILIEVKKAGKKTSQKELDALANKALQQIHEKDYEAHLNSSGVTEIIRFGVAFSGKTVSVVTETNEENEEK